MIHLQIIHFLQWFNMVIFHSYVGLLEAMGQKNVLKPCYHYKEVQLKSPDRPSSPVLGRSGI